MRAYIPQLQRLKVAGIERRFANGEMVVRHATMGRVELEPDRCTGCGLCVPACPVRSLEVTGPKSVRMFGERSPCVACGDCVAICVPAAIRVARPMTYEGLYAHIGRGALAPPRRF